MKDRRGFTILELLIASLILAVLITLAYASMFFVSATSADSIRRANLQEAARKAVDEMARELRVADAPTLKISRYQGSDRAEFRVPRKYAQEEMFWSEPIQYRLERSAMDSNAKGLPDDARLVRVEGEGIRILCTSVEPEDFELERKGYTVRIRLKLRSTDDRGRPIEYSTETMVSLRNRGGK